MNINGVYQLIGFLHGLLRSSKFETKWQIWWPKIGVPFFSSISPLMDKRRLDDIHSKFSMFFLQTPVHYLIPSIKSIYWQVSKGGIAQRRESEQPLLRAYYKASHGLRGGRGRISRSPPHPPRAANNDQPHIWKIKFRLFPDQKNQFSLVTPYTHVTKKLIYIMHPKEAEIHWPTPKFPDLEKFRIHFPIKHFLVFVRSLWWYHSIKWI